MKRLSLLILFFALQSHAGAMFDFYDGLTLPRLEHIKVTSKDAFAKIQETDERGRTFEFFRVTPKVRVITDDEARIARTYLTSINDKLVAHPGKPLSERLSPEQVAYVSDDMLNAAQILLAYQGISYELVVQKAVGSSEERRMILISKGEKTGLNEIARNTWRNKQGVVLFDPRNVLERGNVLDLSVEKTSAPTKRVGLMPLPASPWNQSARMSLESLLSFTEFGEAQTFADTELRAAMIFHVRRLTPPVKPDEKAALPRGHELTIFMSPVQALSDDFRYPSTRDKFFDFRQLELPAQVSLSRAAVLTLTPPQTTFEHEKFASYVQQWISDLKFAGHMVDLMLVQDYGTHPDEAPYAWVDQKNERWIRFVKELPIEGEKRKVLIRMHLFADAFKKQDLFRVPQAALQKQIRFQLLLAKELIEDYAIQALHLKSQLDDSQATAKEIFQYLKANRIQERGSYSTNPIPLSCRLLLE